MRNVVWFVATMLAFTAPLFAQANRPFSPREPDARESAHRDAWQKPEHVVEKLQIQADWLIADIGTGAGYFVPYLSKATGPLGKVYAVDIQQEMLGFVERKAAELGWTNVTTVLSQENDTRLAPRSIDLALLVDVYHELRTPKALLSNIRSILKPGGRVAIIDFYHDMDTPVGPPLRHRAAEQRVIAEAEAVGFELLSRHTFLPYQYFLVFSAAETAKVERH